MRHQILILNRGRKRATNLRSSDRIIAGLCTLLMRPARVSPLQSATPILKGEVSMRFERVSFGSIRIDETTYEHDVVIDRGRVRRRKKKTIQTISRRIRAHAALYRREDTLEVPSAGGGDRHRGLAGHGGSEARGSEPQNQTRQGLRP